MMPLDQVFPGFIKACVDLHASLLPWALPLLVIAFATEFWSGPPAAGDLVKFLVKLFLVILLVTKSHDLINAGQATVQQWVEQNVPARPGNVAGRFQDKLALAQNDPTLKDQSFLRTLFSSNWFEAIIFAVLTLVAWLAIGVQFLVYCVQRVALMLCWTISPLLFPCLAIRPVSHIGLQHILRIAGICLWPLSLALAATCTDGLLDVATDPTFLGPSVAGSLGRGLLTLLSITVVAVWIIFSTVAAPAYIQRLVAGSAGPADVLMQGAELLANIALPALARASAAGCRRYQAGLTGAGNAAPSGHPASAPNNEAMAADLARQPLARAAAESASAPWQPIAGDPTGDIQARAIVEATKKI
jgi:hypothetical protein